MGGALYCAPTIWWKKRDFLEQRGGCGACLFWLTSHHQCHWAWGNSGISIFVHKVQHTLDKRTRMQLPLLQKSCTASIFLTLFLHESLRYYSFTIRYSAGHTRLKKYFWTSTKIREISAGWFLVGQSTQTHPFAHWHFRTDALFCFSLFTWAWQTQTLAHVVLAAVWLHALREFRNL